MSKLERVECGGIPVKLDYYRLEIGKGGDPSRGVLRLGVRGADQMGLLEREVLPRVVSGALTFFSDDGMVMQVFSDTERHYMVDMSGMSEHGSELVFKLFRGGGLPVAEIGSSVEEPKPERRLRRSQGDGTDAESE